MAKNRVSQLGALKQVAEYIANSESGENENYKTYCEENELDPRDIKGMEQSSHVYAVALIGLGLDFSND